MAAIDSVYNYYLSTYGDSIGASRFDSHKKSELKDTYNKIVKSNKDSPLYKINLDDGSLKKFAIDLKEQARSTQAVVSSLSTDETGIEALMHKKIAVSSDPDAVDVEYIGDDDSEKGTSSGFSIKVNSLATPQVNTGNYLNPAGHDFETGTFMFDLDTTKNSYEFQYTVEDGDNNLATQTKIARLINTSDIGLSAEILHDDRDYTALQITSKQTGLAESEDYIFNIQSGLSWTQLNKLGIDNISSPASNSSFELNGTEHESLSNTFTINREFEVTLNAASEGDAANIGFKANTDAIADSVNELLDSYNGLLAVGRSYSNGHNTNRLANEVISIANTMGDELGSVGIVRNDDGSLTLDKEKMAQSITSDTASDAFKSLNKFKNMLNMQAEKAAINPMNYVDKLVVEYKNPASSFSAPYAQSQYAGLLLNKYL